MIDALNYRYICDHAHILLFTLQRHPRGSTSILNQFLTNPSGLCDREPPDISSASGFPFCFAFQTSDLAQVFLFPFGSTRAHFLSSGLWNFANFARATIVSTGKPLTHTSNLHILEIKSRPL